MNILFLWGNPIAKNLEEWLANQDNNVISWQVPVSLEIVREFKIQLIVSYTYRFIIGKDIIDAVNGNAVNLHISYLPWNRGADPNQWSWIDGTPKGVTIHFINEKIDGGDIIAQKLVSMDKNISLRQSYDLLNHEIVMLFKKIYVLYPFWNEMRKRVLGTGSYHSSADFEAYRKIIGDDYDISVETFCERVRKYNEYCD